MGIREITGYIAHVLLAAYWVWVVACTAPQMRKGARDKGLKIRILLVKTAAFLLTAVLVGVIHYWATAWWQVAVAIPVAGVLGVLLRRAYRRLVAAPKHLRTLGQRARTVHIRRPDDTPPAHSHRPVPSRESSIVMNPSRPAPGRSAAPHRGTGPQLRDVAPGLRR
jgi:hypothetical protein